jgi:hypothetical protein
MLDGILSTFTHIRLASLLICVVACVEDVSSWSKDPDEAMRNAIQRFFDSGSFVDQPNNLFFTTSENNLHSTSGSTLQPTTSAYRTSGPELPSAKACTYMYDGR